MAQPPVSSGDPTSFLYVQTARTGSFAAGRLEMDGLEPVLYFTDRPQRLYGSIPLAEFTDFFPSTFRSDPPNAVLEFDSDQGRLAAAVTLLSAEQRDAGVVYQVASLTDAPIAYNNQVVPLTQVPGSLINPSLFIDNLSVGTLYGVVTDSFGSPLPGVVVQVTSKANPDRTTITDADGFYTFSGLLTGEYDLAASLEGLGAANISNITVSPGRQTRQDVVLTNQSP